MNPNRISIERAYKILKPFENRNIFFLREVAAQTKTTKSSALFTLNALIKLGLVEIVDYRKPREYRVTRQGKIFVKTFEGVIN